VRLRLRPRHVRTRLTLWYVGVLAAVLVVYVIASLLYLRLTLRRELDVALHAEFERVEDFLTAGPDGGLRFGEHGDEDEEGSLLEVWSLAGALVYRSGAVPGDVLGGPPRSVDRGRASYASSTLPDGTPVRVLTAWHPVAGQDAVLRVALSEARQHHEWRELQLGLLFGLPVALAVAGVAGHWLARRALRPLERMALKAETLTAENLGARLPVENADDELGHLARVFNASLARIEESFARLRRFTADASHELRTPLTAIRTVGEVALQAEQKPELYREAIGSMLEEVDRLTHLVGSLLTLSRADAGAVLSRRPLRLFDLARDAAALLEILAEEKGQRIEVRGDPSLSAEVDALVLRQALLNLIDNAIKYSPRGASLAVEVSGLEDSALMDVVDEGPGIPESDRAHVFERFYRVDSARSRDDGGVGLGLAIALWAVQAHGGRIEVTHGDGRGSRFRIVLPKNARCT
jgi:heavy metal sensor kinase